ncbi:MAG TPA: hypothetical protein VFE46_08110 [Pirellulales bacterium]|jgi:hypothetical protein|nr:hypothetical protein [Pirellulales bacterium]
MRNFTPVIFIVIGLSMQLRADTISLLPIVDGSAEDDNGDGIFELLLPQNDSQLRAETGAPTSQRAALEFDLAMIPSSAQIQSAYLLLTMTARDNHTADFVVNGYVGDGVIQLSDFNAGNPILEVSFPASDPIPLTPNRFDVTAGLNDLMASQAEIAGFGLSVNSISLLNFASNENSQSTWRPTLEVNYTVPEPSSSELAVAGILVGLFLFKKSSPSIRLVPVRFCKKNIYEQNCHPPQVIVRGTRDT